MKKIIYFAPRVLSILYACFISIFALDVFTAGYVGSELVIALFMHLLPTLIFVIAIMIAWKKDIVGVFLFLILGTMTFFGFNTYRQLLSFLFITMPLIVTALLFLISYKKNIYDNNRRIEEN